MKEIDSLASLIRLWIPSTVQKNHIQTSQGRLLSGGGEEAATETAGPSTEETIGVEGTHFAKELLPKGHAASGRTD